MNTYIKDYNIFPDAEKVQTAAIQKAIDDCAQSGGGTIHFEPGIYRTGTIYLRSNTYLNLPPMCVIKGSDNLDDYNDSYAWQQNAVIPPERANGKHLIVALEVENCGIRGGGIVDGNGKHFGFRIEEGFSRPSQMVYLCESKNIRIRDVELLNSTYWTCFVHGCEDVIITGVRIKNNPEIPNCDGIDIDTSRRVIVSDCLIDSQDDCITFRCDNQLFSKLKDKTKILEDVTVTNCQLRTAGCNAIRVGVGIGTIRNCQVSNVIIRDSAKGVCLEARYVFNNDERPGTKIENLSFNNIFMEAKCPIFLASQCDALTNLPAPDIRNIRFSNLTAVAEHNIVVQANEGAVVENILFSNADITFKGIPECIDKYGYGEWDYKTSSGGFYVANAQNVTMDNVNIHIEEKDSPVSKGVIAHNASVNFSNVQAEKAKTPVEICERSK